MKAVAMRNKIKKFYQDNKLVVGAALGAVAGGAAVYVYYDRKILLELPKNAAEHMRNTGDAVLYEVPSQGDFLLKLIG